MGVFGHDLWCCPSSVGCLWCSWLGFGFGLLLGRVWFRGRPACPPPFRVPARGVGVCAGPGSRLCSVRLGWVVGVCFFFFFFALVFSFLFCFFFPGFVVPVPPSPFFRAGLVALFFFFFFFSVSLFPVVRCYWLGVAGFGWVVPLCLCGGPPFFFFFFFFFPWGGAWPPVVVLAGGWAAVGCFRAFSPSPLLFFFFFFFGGGACLFLPLPSLGWRTHWPAFSVVFRSAVFSHVLCGHVPAPWVGWALYTVGSAPLLAGLGPGSAGWAAAPGGCLWFWVRGLGLFVSLPLCGAGCNLLGGPSPLSPGALWPRVWPVVLVCGVVARRLPGCAVAGFG